jgi:hypothetical protein
MERRSFVSLLAGTAGIAGWRSPALAQAGALVPMFNGRDFTGWDRIGTANWRVEDGALVADRGNGFLVSQRDYRDFQLRAEVFIDTHSNSGIFIRCSDPSTVGSANAYEVNIWDERPEQRYGTGAEGGRALERFRDHRRRRCLYGCPERSEDRRRRARCAFRQRADRAAAWPGRAGPGRGGERHRSGALPKGGDPSGLNTTRVQSVEGTGDAVPRC